MNIELYLEKFSKTLTELRNDIESLELSNKTEVLVESSKSSVEQLNFFYKTCTELANDFSSHNAIIFGENTVLLEGIHFYLLWNNELSEDSQKSIWKYLETLYLYAYNYINKKEIGEIISTFKNTSLEEAEQLEGENKIVFTIISNLNQDKKIKKLEKEGEKSKEEELNKTIDKTAIGKLAKEIASEINPEDFKDDLLKEDPSNLLNNLLTGNIDKQGGIAKLINCIGDKINSRMKSGDITEDTLLTEAQGIMKNTDILGNLPDLSSLMNPEGGKSKSKTGGSRKKLQEKKKLLKDKKNKAKSNE